MTVRLQGIYGVLPADLDEDDLLKRAEAALNGGVRIIQYRDKKQKYAHAVKRAKALRRLTSEFDAIFIVNDQVQLALDSDADGVHLGRNDMTNLTQLRTVVGQDIIIGVSCQGDAAFARHVEESGASYVAFGSIFPTTTKADVAVIGPARLAKARQMFPDTNIVAIGGISKERVPYIRAAGADCAAVISALFEPAEGIEDRASSLVKTWDQARA